MPLIIRVGRNNRILQSLTLNEFEAYYAAGLISNVHAKLYLREWNATPCRFNTAYLQGVNVCLRLNT